MAIADTIYELVKTLPEGKANLVLTFAQFVQQQDQVLGVNGSAESIVQCVATTQSERVALSQQAKGRFAHLPNSSEAFAQQKQAEIDWEDRHR
ncbi:hypothetical protein [Leptolyngbya sp. PCC 6406]|uniref:hypothetical protein n=1 Tax=Leptolyngbya sp. PCC 6406 TaxID=1173264 RepID=UPI0002ACEF2A|nr:hypothetical protein [Leptolyngbya sp. PCC 6406]